VNKERIRAFANHLAASPTPAGMRFEMSMWFWPGTPVLQPCGCMATHAVVYNLLEEGVPQEEVFKDLAPFMPELPAMRPHTVNIRLVTKAMDYFDIDLITANKLFTNVGLLEIPQQLQSVTREVAVNVLEILAATGQVDWRWAFEQAGFSCAWPTSTDDDNPTRNKEIAA
jgi:hypothetical protein